MNQENVNDGGFFAIKAIRLQIATILKMYSTIGFFQVIFRII